MVPNIIYQTDQVLYKNITITIRFVFSGPRCSGMSDMIQKETERNESHDSHPPFSSHTPCTSRRQLEMRPSSVMQTQPGRPCTTKTILTLFDLVALTSTLLIVEFVSIYLFIGVSINFD